MSKNEEPVELCVILPYTEYRSIEQRAKRDQSLEVKPSIPESPSPPVLTENDSDSEDKTESVQSPEPMKAPQIGTEKVKKKELKNTYRATQIKKMLKQIEKISTSKELTKLENLDALIQLALGSSKKTIPNEKQFFTFLFENNLGHFVRNRNKINLYYKYKDSWWAV